MVRCALEEAGKGTGRRGKAPQQQQKSAGRDFNGKMRVMLKKAGWKLGEAGMDIGGHGKIDGKWQPGA
jgi:hypothetical protein